MGASKAVPLYERLARQENPSDRQMIELRSICMRYPYGKVQRVPMRRNELFGETKELHPLLEKHFSPHIEYRLDLVVKQMETPHGVDFIPVPIFTERRNFREDDNFETISESESQELVRIAGITNIYCALAWYLTETV